MTARTAFVIMVVVGVVYAAVGLFSPTWRDLALGLIVASVGVIGIGAIDWVNK